MDTFVMQHKEAREEERDYLTCWQSKAIVFDSSRLRPHPTPEPGGGWEDERQSYLLRNPTQAASPSPLSQHLPRGGHSRAWHVSQDVPRE